MKYLVYIHGLGGQRDWGRNSLTTHWTDALQHSTWRSLDDTRVNISMAWWARYERDTTLGITDVAAKVQRWPDQLRTALRDQKSKAISKVMTPVIDRLFPALHRYFTGEDFRTAVQESLRTELAAAQQADDTVCLVAHSMGSVVAYDVLSTMKNHKVDTVITMGSPLGLPSVRRDMRDLHGSKVLEFPQRVRKWINVYDPGDTITKPEPALARHYRTAAGARIIQDHKIRLNYSDTGKRDPHHWFGYLSSPEIGSTVSQFLWG